MSANQTTRQTLKDFLASRGSSAETISLSPNPSDASPDGVLNEGDDLGADPNTGIPVIGLQGLASAYVAFLTQQSGNEYPLNVSGEQAASFERGSPIEVADSQGSSRVFVESGTSLGQALSTLSNSGQLDTGRFKISDYLNKTGAELNKSGNTLLSEVIGQALDTTGNTVATQSPINTDTQAGRLQATIQNNINTNNRLTPDQPAANDRNDINIDTVKIQAAQRAFGDYQKVDDGNNTASFSYDQIKDVGNWLLAAAAGYDVQNIQSGQTKVVYDNISSNNNEQNVRNLQGQLSDFKGPGLDDLRSSNANGYPKIQSGESFRADRGDVQKQQDSDAKYSKSGVTTYTPEAQAANFLDEKSLNLAQARACYAVIKLALLLGDKYRKFVAGDDKVDTLKSLGPYYMGGSVYSRVDALCRMKMNVMLVPTRNKYDDAVQAGMFVMLGRDPTNPNNVIPGNFGLVSNSPVYWDAVAESAFNAIRDKDLPVNNPALMGQYYIELGRSPAIRAMNVFATIGDIVLQVTGRQFNADSYTQDIRDAQGIDSIDKLPVSAGTRISKSREGTGRSPLALSWRGNSVPGLYMLPNDAIQAAMTMGNVLTGENPARGMLASSLVNKTYVDPSLKGERARIPGDIVKIVEDKLDAEYVPFYFHDLRTNEIISFHAFLENLNDSFSAKYNSYRSYGRSDAVKTYSATDRTVSLSFTVVATSRDDFDEMWFKINRLIASTYPKYTPGQKVKTGDIEFEQPFSQVVGATPLMRLRVGDVIRGNYSKFNLARFFGIGSDGTDVSNFKKGENRNKIEKSINAVQSFAKLGSGYDKYRIAAFYTLFGTPLKTIAHSFGTDFLNNQAATDISSNVLVNGFVNPLGYALMTNYTLSPDTTNWTDTLDLGRSGYRTYVGIVYIKPRERPYDVVNGSGTNVLGKARIRRQVRARITSATTQKTIRDGSSDPSYQTANKIGSTTSQTTETRYVVQVIDPGTVFDPTQQNNLNPFEGDALFGENILVTHDDLVPDLGAVFAPAAVTTDPANTLIDASLAALDSAASIVNISSTSLFGDDVTLDSGTSQFMSSDNNAIVRAFENNRGRGLAGVITQLSFNWLEFPWETDWGARAPMGAKVTISFECMHDLPPGLDASGYMRAPTHNVGSVMQTIAGDPYDDRGVNSRTNFVNDGASSVVKRS